MHALEIATGGPDRKVCPFARPQGLIAITKDGGATVDNFTLAFVSVRT